MIPQKDPPLGEQSLRDLERLYRLRAATLRLLHLLCPEEGLDALRIRHDRGAAVGLYQKLPMPGPGREHYYIIGQRAISTLNLPGNRAHKKAQGFSQAGLINHLAIGYLCAHHGLFRLRPDEIESYLPGHTRPGLPSQNYLIRADGTDPVLYWAIPDVCSPAKVFPSKVGKAVAKRYSIPAFSTRINRGEFACAIITSNEAKARQIEDALAESDLQFSNVGVLVVPEIEPLQLP